MKKILTKIIGIFLFSLVLTSPVLAQTLQDAFKAGSVEDGQVKLSPLDTVAGDAGYDPGNTFDSMVGKIILAALSLLGIIFLILLIYAGYLWMTAAGNDQQVSKAQSMITTAVIGLIIVISAYSISYFVLDSMQKGALQETGTTETP